MLLCGLEAGLTMADMRSMSYTELVQVIWEWEDMRAPADGKPRARDATPDDIRWLESL